MDKATGLALLAAGIALITFGVWDSMNSDAMLTFASMPSDQVVWLLLCGGIEVVAGAVMTVRSFDREEK